MSDIINYLFKPTACWQISNDDCKKINKSREIKNRKYRIIEVGLELPNANNPKELVRFVPRYVKIITK